MYFKFANPNEEHITRLSSTILLHIKRITHSVSLLYFTDEMDNKIPIPIYFTISTHDYQDTRKRVLCHPVDNKEYALCWTENYDIQYNGMEILHIENERTWNITNIA